MNTEILGVVVQIALMVILAYPLGKYIAKVYRGERPGLILWLLSKESFIKFVESTPMKK